MQSKSKLNSRCSFSGNPKPDMLSDPVFKLLVCICLLLAVVAFMSINVNAPFSLATNSRALYVDEGFYADAAQNFIKFGQWDLPFDSRHWPGAPLLALIQSMIFSIFGVSLSVARMISVVFGMLSCLSLYAISRCRLPGFISLPLSVAGVLSFTFMAHTRTAIADPVALALSLAALAVYVRMNNKMIAISLSLILGYFAFCTKMYYLYGFATIIGLWCMELIVVPLVFRKKTPWLFILLFFISLVLIAFSYAGIRIAFSDEFADFLSINSNKKPSLNPLVLYDHLIISLHALPRNTNNHIFLGCLVIAVSLFILTRLLPSNFKRLHKDILLLSRGQWGMLFFLLSGLITAAGLHKPDKAHYYYFSILPVAYLSVTWLYLLLPPKWSKVVVSFVLLIHLIWQSHFYSLWLQRESNTSIGLANGEIVHLILQHYDSEQRIPIIGEYSAQLSLHNQRMLSLDAKWASQEQLCERLDYWRPKFHVNLQWPGSLKLGILKRLNACEEVALIEDVLRVPVFEPWQDELVLTRLYYID